MTANARKPMLHNEGLVTKNTLATTFKFLRRHLYARRGWDGHRSSHRSRALFVRRAGQLAECQPRLALFTRSKRFPRPASPARRLNVVPHTVRAKETKQCSDCHVSAQKRQQRLDGAVVVAGQPTS